MVSEEGLVGAVGDLLAGYALLLRVVGCLVSEVCSFNDHKVAASADRGVSGKQQLAELNRDVNFSRDAIFNEVREVNER